MGEAVDPADAAVAVRIADRELDRLARVSGATRVTVWRVLHAVVAAVMLVNAVILVAESRWLNAAGAAALGTLLATSALRARHRLARQVERVARSRERNAALLG